MAGWMYSGGEYGVSLGSSAIDFIASYLRPYITEVIRWVYVNHI